MIVNGIEVCVERKDIKNTHLAVYPPDAHVHVSAPLRLSDADVRSFVLSKWTWVQKKREEVLSQERQTKREYVSGENHYLFGVRYRLKVIERDELGCSITKSPGVIRMRVHRNSSVKYREEAMWHWYAAALVERLQGMLADRLKEFGLADTCQWKVKRMKNRWGSYTRSSRKILFNTELARVPIECIDYIVVHELTHRDVANHGRLFTELMDKRLPNWRLLRQRLNDFIAAPERGAVTKMEGAA